MNLTSTIFSVYYTELIWPAFSKVNEKWEKSILHSVLHLSEILSNNKYFGNQPFVMLQKAVIPHQGCCLLNTPRLPLGLILTCGTTQHPSFPGNRNQAFLQGLGVSRTSWSLLFFLRNVCISLQQRSPDRWIEQRPVDAVTVFDYWIHWHNSDTEQEEISQKPCLRHTLTYLRLWSDKPHEPWRWPVPFAVEPWTRTDPRMNNERARKRTVL